MKLTRSIGVIGLLALINTAPAKAQDTAAAEGWVDWGSGLVGEALHTLAYPFQRAWTMAWDAIGHTEAEVASEKVKFANKLKTGLADFSKDVSRTGYDVSIIGISPDVIPKISLTLEVREPVNETVEAELRTEFQNKEKFGVIERTILQGLLDLDETAESLKVEGYRFSEVELELVAIFPEVTFNFEREELSSSDPAPSPAAPKTEDGTSRVLSD